MKKTIFAVVAVLSFTLASSIVAPASAFDNRHQFSPSEGNG